MARLLKEREVDQDLYEALNFAMRDDEDLLCSLEALVREDEADGERAAEADRLAASAEERARLRVANAEHELQEARHDQQLAHEQRMVTKRLHSAAKVRDQREARIVKDLRMHTARNRKGVLEWAVFKDFAKDLLPETQLFANGGLRALVASHKHREADAPVELSAAEAEAV